MYSTLKILAVATLSATIALPTSLAQNPQDHQDHPDQQGHHDNRQDQRDNHSAGPHNDDHSGGGPGGNYVRHNDWRKGRRMPQADWNRGQRVDYRTYHLNAPPRGYEWRAVDGNYVLAAVATGLVSSIIIASTMH